VDKNRNKKLSTSIFFVGAFLFLAFFKVSLGADSPGMTNEEFQALASSNDFQSALDLCGQYDPNDPGRPQGCSTLTIDGSIQRVDSTGSPDGNILTPGIVAPPSSGTMFNYTLLESIPFVGSAGGSVTLDGLVVGMYKFGVGTVGIAALFMLTVGGFMYITSAGNTSSAGKAKEVITDALLGLFIALTAWGLLYIINPDLVGPGAANPSLFSAQISQNVAENIPSPAQVALMEQNLKDLGLPDLAREVQSKLGGKLVSSGDCKDVNGRTVSPASNIQEIVDGKNMTACNSTCSSAGTPCRGVVQPKKEMLQALVGLSGQITAVVSIAGGPHGKKSGTSDHYGNGGLNGVDLVFPKGAPTSQQPRGSTTDWQKYVNSLTSTYGARTDRTACDGAGLWARINGSLNCENPMAASLDGTKSAPVDHIHASF